MHVAETFNFHRNYVFSNFSSWRKRKNLTEKGCGMLMFIVWGRLKFWPGCIPADADAQKISSRRIKFWPGCTADDCLKFLATGDQTCLTFTTLSSLLFKLWWQLNIQDNIFVVQNLDEAEKSPLEVTNFHVSYFVRQLSGTREIGGLWQIAVFVGFVWWQDFLAVALQPIFARSPAGCWVEWPNVNIQMFPIAPGCGVI